MSTTTITDQHDLADVIERYAGMVVAALRSEPAAPADAASGPFGTSGSARYEALPQGGPVSWKQVDVIKSHKATWPAPESLKSQGHDELEEHYGPMPVYESHDGGSVVRLAVGEPHERFEFYGKERGYISVWEIVNGRPARQLAVFSEADDFEQTHERVALISGKDGASKKGFAPNERHLLPSIYGGLRVEVQRDRIVGPYSRNRLVVVARDDEVETMLNHGLAHLRLRS